MPEFTVGAGFARGLAGFAAAKGADEAVLLARAGIDRLALLDQDARLPFSSYVALMRAGQALTGDPALGLHFGERVGIAEVSIIGLLGQASENMLEAFAQLNRYVRLIVETDNGGDADRFRFAMERGGLWMVDNRRGAETFPELTESAFAQLVCSARRASGLLVVRAVHLTYRDPGYAAEYERIFRVPVTFGSNRNALQIDEALLSSCQLSYIIKSAHNQFSMMTTRQPISELLKDEKIDLFKEDTNGKKEPSLKEKRPNEEVVTSKCAHCIIM